MGNSQSVSRSTSSNTNDTYQSNRVQSDVDFRTSAVGKSAIHNCCSHNRRDGVSLFDLAEHAGNQSWGSLGRDLTDTISGKEKWAGLDQESRKSNNDRQDT